MTLAIRIFLLNKYIYTTYDFIWFSAGGGDEGYNMRNLMQPRFEEGIINLLTCVKGFDQWCQPGIILKPLAVLGLDDSVDERVVGPEGGRRGTRSPQLLEITGQNIFARHFIFKVMVHIKWLKFLPGFSVHVARCWLDGFERFLVWEHLHLWKSMIKWRIYLAPVAFILGCAFFHFLLADFHWPSFCN